MGGSLRLSRKPPTHCSFAAAAKASEADTVAAALLEGSSSMDLRTRWRKKKRQSAASNLDWETSV